MEEKLGEILDNVLGLLLLEGSYDIEETEEALNVTIETKDAGRLIGFKGENLESLQLILNQLMSRKIGEEGPVLSETSTVSSVEPQSESNGFKRVLVDVEGWRKQKEEELSSRAKSWGQEVLESGKEMELEPMPSWQRRIVHLVISETPGLQSESIGEGRDRHLVIRPLKT